MNTINFKVKLSVEQLCSYCFIYATKPPLPEERRELLQQNLPYAIREALFPINMLEDDVHAKIIEQTAFNSWVVVVENFKNSGESSSIWFKKLVEVVEEIYNHSQTDEACYEYIIKPGLERSLQELKMESEQIQEKLYSAKFQTEKAWNLLQDITEKHVTNTRGMFKPRTDKKLKFQAISIENDEGDVEIEATLEEFLAMAYWAMQNTSGTSSLLIEMLYEIRRAYNIFDGEDFPDIHQYATRIADHSSCPGGIVVRLMQMLAKAEYHGANIKYATPDIRKELGCKIVGLFKNEELSIERKFYFQKWFVSGGIPENLSNIILSKLSADKELCKEINIDEQKAALDRMSMPVALLPKIIIKDDFIDEDNQMFLLAENMIPYYLITSEGYQNKYHYIYHTFLKDKDAGRQKEIINIIIPTDYYLISELSFFDHLEMIYLTLQHGLNLPKTTYSLLLIDAAYNPNLIKHAEIILTKHPKTECLSLVKSMIANDLGNTKSAFSIAIEEGNWQFIELILKTIPDEDYLLLLRLQESLTAIMLAIKIKDYHIMELLINRAKADQLPLILKQQDENGDSICMMLLKHGAKDYAPQILFRVLNVPEAEKSAILAIKNNDGKTLLDIAREQGQFQIVELIKRSSAQKRGREEQDDEPQQEGGHASKVRRGNSDNDWSMKR